MLINKTIVNFPQAFATASEPVSQFFAQPGIGYYVPLYQRAYSWDRENVEQLMTDLSQGAEMLLEQDDTILFMGTIILLTESNPTVNINPRDPRALPSRIDNVIDGQQRISTFAMLATVLYDKLEKAWKQFDQAVQRVPAAAALSPEVVQEVSEVGQEITSRLNSLREIFSVNLSRGTPTYKPIIIRGNQDGWTYDGPDAANYPSDVAGHLARTLRALNDRTPIPFADATGAVKDNLNLMSAALKDVEEAYKPREGHPFPAAWQILTGTTSLGLPQEALWSFDKPELTSLVQLAKEQAQNSELKSLSVEARLCSLVQLLAFTNFLLNRCCFIVIKPTAESWAFDMFQSLNATGTPLTAVETFKPLVINRHNIDHASGYVGMYVGSRTEVYLNKIDALFEKTDTAAKKSTQTNEFLTTFAATQDGRKLPSQFSAQRRHLQKGFDTCDTPAKREEFVHRLSDLAEYRKDVESMLSDLTGSSRVAHTAGSTDSERQLATLSLAYLRRAGHKMADALISRFYSNLLRAAPNTRSVAESEFMGAVKAIAAFYTLWRAALPNAGLDDFHRMSLRGGLAVDPLRPEYGRMGWGGDPTQLNLVVLKSRLREGLNIRGVGNKAMWLSRAVTELRYDNSVDQVCRFALLVSTNDTLPDVASPGLMTKGTTGLQPYLTLEKWLSPDLSTLEHIAPQTPASRTPWDINLYGDDVYQRIGNLTLLPGEINVSASNRGWMEKCLYYQYISAANPVIDRPAILADAASRGVNLTQNNLALLDQANYHAPVLPIAAVGLTGVWDKALVERRSERIASLLWDELYKWIS